MEWFVGCDLNWDNCYYESDLPDIKLSWTQAPDIVAARANLNYPRHVEAVPYLDGLK